MQAVRFGLFHEHDKDAGLKLPFEEGCMKEIAEKLEKKLMKEA